MRTYHHRFKGRTPLVRWKLYDEQQRCIASGWALSQDSAWRKSIDALPPGPSIDELLKVVK